MTEQNPGKQAVDTAIANTAIHDCDDSTYEVHVSAATLQMLAQLRENFITGLNIYSLIEATMLKYAESHATKDYLLVKSSQAYKEMNEINNKELVELRQLVEELKKEQSELREELETYRSKATVTVEENNDENGEYVLKEARNVEHSSEHTVTLSDEDLNRIREGMLESIKRTKEITGSAANGIIEIGSGVIKFIPSTEHGSDNVLSDSSFPQDESKDKVMGNSEETTDSRGNSRYYQTTEIVPPLVRDDSDDIESNSVLPSHVHPHPNGAGNGVFVSTGKPDDDSDDRAKQFHSWVNKETYTSRPVFTPAMAFSSEPPTGTEKISVTENSKVTDTKI